MRLEEIRREVSLHVVWDSRREEKTKGNVWYIFYKFSPSKILKIHIIQNLTKEINFLANKLEVWGGQILSISLLYSLSDITNQKIKCFPITSFVFSPQNLPSKHSIKDRSKEDLKLAWRKDRTITDIFPIFQLQLWSIR